MPLGPDNRLSAQQVVQQKRRVRNPDKSISTERTVTLETDQGFINVPTLYQGNPISPSESMQLIQQGVLQGSPLFATREEAIAEAQKRSDAIGKSLGREQTMNFFRKLLGR